MTTPPKKRVNYTVVQVNNDVYFDNLKPYLDSNKQNVIVCGSLNRDFALSLVRAVGENAKYRTTIVGMPNWDGMSKLYSNDYPNVEIVYSTPYNYPPTDEKVRNVTNIYRSQFSARPSDVVFKSYEAMYHYTHIAAEYKNEFIGHLSDTTYTWNSDFFLKPVFVSSQSLLPDYFENKTLYFVRKSKKATVSVTQVENCGIGVEHKPLLLSFVSIY